MKMMIIDDVMMNVLVLRNIVQHLGQVDHFQNPAEGLNALAEAYRRGAPYDLLFLDIFMPGRSGLEVLKVVQKLNQEVPGIKTKVVMVTSQKGRESFQAAMRDGAVGYILKPFQPERILEEVRRLTEGGEKDREAAPGRSTEAA
jgi:CheY-like chemotaxis protein